MCLLVSDRGDRCPRSVPEKWSGGVYVPVASGIRRKMFVSDASPLTKCIVIVMAKDHRIRTIDTQVSFECYTCCLKVDHTLPFTL